MARPESHPQKIRSTRATDDAGPHLWQIAAVRDIMIVSGAVFCLWLLYLLADIFLPVFLALILAHIINPFVTLMERRWHWPRPLTIVLILIAITLSLMGVLSWIGPVLYEQSTTLGAKLPDYLRALAATYGIESFSPMPVIGFFQLL
jgi:predicted PurR-regulated permease PerM